MPPPPLLPPLQEQKLELHLQVAHPQLQPLLLPLTQRRGLPVPSRPPLRPLHLQQLQQLRQRAGPRTRRCPC